MKIRLRKVPVESLKRGDQFMARMKPSPFHRSGYVIAFVLNGRQVRLFDGRTREPLGTAGFPVWKIIGRTRGKVSK